MKRLLASAVVLSITIASPIAYASNFRESSVVRLQLAAQDNIITKGEAVESASKVYPELKDRKDINVDIVDRFGIYGEKVWRVYLTNDNLFSIYVKASTGDVMSFRIPEKVQQSKYYMPNYTKKECVQAAQEFINKLQPDEARQVRYNADLNSPVIMNDGVQKPVFYTFSFTREINGIQFAKDGFRITVDSYTKNIVKYDFNWQGALEVNLNNIINPDKAKEILKEYTKPRLMYIKQPDKKNSSDKYKLVYSVPYGLYYNTDFAGVDAQKGTPVNHEGKPTEIYTEYLKGNEVIENELKDQNKQLSSNEMDKAMKIARGELRRFNVSTGDYINTTSKYDDNYNNSATKAFIFEWARNTKDSSALTATIRVVVNADTQNIQEFIFNTPLAGKDDSESPSIGWEEAKDMAKEFAVKSFPNLQNDLVFIGVRPKPVATSEVSNRSYCFTFLRLADRDKKIIYPENYVNVNIDKYTGNITGYGYKWESIKFPIVKDIISADSAQEIYLENAGIQLNYKYNYKDSLSKSGVLVYETKPFNYACIDAYTGVIKGFDGSEYMQKSGNSKVDITKYTKDLLIQRQLEIMDDINAIDFDENFNLGNTIKCNQFIKMLVKLKGTESNIKSKSGVDEKSVSYERLARSMGILNDKMDYSGDSALTRQEMAQLIINFMGYDDLLKLKALSNTTFKDKGKFDSDKLVASNVANSLGIVVANESGSFEPTKSVSIQEAIQSIFKAVQ